MNAAIKLLMNILGAHDTVHAIDPQIFRGSARDRNSVLDDVNLLLVPWEHSAHFTLMLAEFYQDECWCYHIDSLRGRTWAKSRRGTTRANPLRRTDPQFAIFVDLLQGSRPALRISRKTTIHTGLQTGGLDCAFWVLATCSYAMDRHAAGEFSRHGNRVQASANVLKFSPRSGIRTCRCNTTGYHRRHRSCLSDPRVLGTDHYSYPTGSDGSLIDVDDDASDDSSSPIPIDPPIYHVPDDDLEDPPDHIPDRTCALGDVSDRPAAWFPTRESRGESTPIEILIDPSLDEPEHVPDDDHEHVPDDDYNDDPKDVPDDDPEHVPAEVPAERVPAERVPEEVPADVPEEERWPGEIDNGPPPLPPASYQAVPFEQCYHCLNPHGLVRYVARNNTNAQKLWMNHLVQTGEPYWLCREHVCHNRITNPARACRDRATVIPPGRLKRPRGYLIPTSSGKPKCWRHHREDENGRLNKQEYHKRKSELNKQPVVRRDDAWNDP